MKTKKRGNYLTLLSLVLLIAFISTTEAKECCGKELIGAKATLDFPKMSLFNINAKVDTGANSSALHCSMIDIDFENRRVKFSPLDSHEIFEYPVIKIKSVTSSQGHKQERAFIMLQIKIHGHIYETLFSLTKRYKMRYPILLGRKALVDRFLVDVSIEK